MWKHKLHTCMFLLSFFLIFFKITMYVVISWNKSDWCVLIKIESSSYISTLVNVQLFFFTSTYQSFSNLELYWHENTALFFLENENNISRQMCSNEMPFWHYNMNSHSKLKWCWEENSLKFQSKMHLKCFAIKLKPVKFWPVIKCSTSSSFLCKINGKFILN